MVIKAKARPHGRACLLEKGHDMYPTTRASKLAKAGNLNGRWNLLTKRRKAYARYLVSAYGYPVRVAIQQVYIFGFQDWPYDYRNSECVKERMPASAFGF